MYQTYGYSIKGKVIKLLFLGPVSYVRTGRYSQQTKTCGFTPYPAMATNFHPRTPLSRLFEKNTNLVQPKRKCE
jgi:hypothetical protein